MLAQSRDAVADAALDAGDEHSPGAAAGQAACPRVPPEGGGRANPSGL